MYAMLFKISYRGSWLDQLVECETLDLGGHEFKPHLGGRVYQKKKKKKKEKNISNNLILQLSKYFHSNIITGYLFNNSTCILNCTTVLALFQELGVLNQAMQSSGLEWLGSQ